VLIGFLGAGVGHELAIFRVILFGLPCVLFTFVNAQLSEGEREVLIDFYHAIERLARPMLAECD
jgi:hypothetical protein